MLITPSFIAYSADTHRKIIYAILGMTIAIPENIAFPTFFLTQFNVKDIILVINVINTIIILYTIISCMMYAILPFFSVEYFLS